MIRRPAPRKLTATNDSELLQKQENFHTETIHPLAIMGLTQGEEDDHMSTTDIETLIILIVTWLPMLWISRPAKHHS